MCWLPMPAACIFCWTPQGGTRKLLSPEEHPRAARAPQTAYFGTGSAPATGWGASAQASSRTEKILHGDYSFLTQAMFSWVPRKDMPSRVICSTTFVVVGSLQNKKAFGAGHILIPAPMWGYLPFPIAVHWGPCDIGYPRCPQPWVHPRVKPE